VPDLAAPDYAAPVQAWRIWLVVCRGDWLRLGSVVYDVAWPPGEPLVAECLRQRRAARRRWRKERLTHAAPQQRCQCGIYAIDDPFELGSYLDSRYPDRDGAHRIVGRVSLWGTVVESERGWRASHAYPAHLYVPLPRETSDRAGAEAIAAELAEYGVPIEVVAEQATPDLLETLAVGAEPEAA
jgi:hypothetical protein